MKHETGIRVLVVDDEPAICTVLTDLLRMEGYTVITAQNGIDALRHLIEPLPDVVISDLQMPVMSGYEFMSILRHRFPQVPVIAISGEYKAGDLPAHVPADAFLSKGGYTIEDLNRTIRELVCASPIRPYAPTNREASIPVPIDTSGNLQLHCENCLRPFLVVAGSMNGGFHAAQCVSCHSFVNFKIDHRDGGVIVQPDHSVVRKK